MRRIAESFVLVAVLVVLASGGRAGDEADDRRPAVGLLLPDDAGSARALRRGARLAAAAHGVRLVERAPQGAWSTHAEAAVALRFEERVDGIVAPADRRIAHAAAQVATRSRTPLVVLSTADALTRTGVPWIERVGPDERTRLAALLAAIPPGARAVVVVDDDDEGRRTAVRVAAAWGRAGRAAAGLTTVAGTDAVVSRSGPAGAVVLACRPDAATAVLESLAAASWTGLRLAGPDLDPAAIAAKPVARGVVACRPADPATDPGGAPFVAAWRKAHEGPPDATAWAGWRAVARLAARLAAADPLGAATDDRTTSVRLVRIGRAGCLDPIEPDEEQR